MQSSNSKDNKTKVQNIKRIIAWIVIILLGALYLLTLILALTGATFNSNLFALCLIGTFVLPILGFVIIWLYSRYNDLHAPGDPTTNIADEPLEDSYSDKDIEN